MNKYQVQMIGIDDIKLSKENRRHEDDKQLIQSIKDIGILNPIQVRKVRKKYEVVAGHRRLVSALAFGLTEIPCIVVNSNITAIQAVENLDRKPLNPLDEAEMIVRLRADGVSDVTIRDWLKLSQRQFNKRLMILDLCEEAKQDIKTGELSLGAAEEIASITDNNWQSEFYSRLSPEDKQTSFGCKNRLKYNGRWLNKMYQPFLEYIAKDGTQCIHCPTVLGGVSDNESLFSQEEDGKRCLNPLCFQRRYNEFVEVADIPTTPPKGYERSWCYDEPADKDQMIMVLTESGVEYYKAKAKPSEKTDKTIFQTAVSAYKRSIQDLEIVLLKMMKEMANELRDWRRACPENKFMDLMAAFICKNQSHTIEHVASLLHEDPKVYPKTIAEICKNIIDDSCTVMGEKAEVTAIAMLLIKIMPHWRITMQELLPSPPTDRWPSMISRTNAITSAHKDICPSDDNRYQESWEEEWADYERLQKEAGNPKAMEEEHVRRCRVCGCTDDHACEGGCYWVEEDLCSQCQED